MALTLPDWGEGDSNLQSIMFQEYLDVLLAGINGIDCVLSGCAVTGGADMTPAVAKGAVLTNGVLKPVTAADVTIGTADATNPRIDLIVVDSTGAKQVRAGTAAPYVPGSSAPKPPARSANDVVIAAVYVPAGDTSIETSKCIDMRVMRQQGPITIYKTTVAETTNNTAAAIQALFKANSGVSIPNGLFLSGKTLRVRMGGNMLVNSGTPTITLTIAYGGTTMFSDVSATATADVDRRAWWLTFDIMAQGNSDQALVGAFDTAAVAGGTAPATGTGDVWAHTHTAGAFSGAAAVNSDAADSLLSVQITFSVANAANELVVEHATVELV